MSAAPDILGSTAPNTPRSTAPENDASAAPDPSATRWLVTGAGGMLGHDVVAALLAGGRKVTALSRAYLDITNTAAVADAVATHAGPGGVVVNCAAYTAVDAAETAEPAAFRLNAVAPARLAAGCAAVGARMVHVSTDYVFDGGSDEPYAESTVPAPVSAYGRTKAAGEWAVRAALPDSSWTVRTAWLYGEHGGNFVRTMLRLAGERQTVSVVDDQTGQPTWAGEVASAIVRLVDAGAPPGTYHATAAGSTTKFGLTRRVFDLAGLDPARVRPTTTEAFPLPAPRPVSSVLGHDAWAAAGLTAPQDWDRTLTRVLPRLAAAWA